MFVTVAGALLFGTHFSAKVGTGGGGTTSETLVPSAFFGGGEVSSSEEELTRSGSSEEPEEDSEEDDSLSLSFLSASLSSCVVNIVGIGGGGIILETRVLSSLLGGSGDSFSSVIHCQTCSNSSELSDSQSCVVKMVGICGGGFVS